MTLQEYCSNNPQKQFLLAQWHPTKNNTLTPSDVAPFSNKKIWWLCKNGHEWKAIIGNRVKRNDQCPQCSGKRVTLGINDLLSVNPVLSSEWHPTKNGNTLPSSVSAMSHKKVWWLGKCGHEWEAQIANRSLGRGCPLCGKRTQTSFPEQALYYYVKKLFPDAKNGYIDIFDNGMELDVYIPSIQTGVEYDGQQWHQKETTWREQTKYRICKHNGITLIRIKEGISTISDDEICDKCIHIAAHPSNQDLDKGIINLLGEIMPISFMDVNTEKDDLNIREAYVSELQNNSLAITHPQIAEDWHPTQNGLLTAQMFTAGSKEKVWWLCKNGHSYRAAISERRKGDGCPYCSGQQVLVGFNDLATVNPILAKDWHPTLNGELKPDMVTSKSNKAVWWQCDKGHAPWKSKINNRSYGKGCPYCSGRKAIQGDNDLLTCYPEIASEWHPSKNSSLTPDVVSIYSNNAVFSACDEAIEEIKNMVRIIVNEFSGKRIFITADHGFLYTYQPLTEDSKVDSKDWKEAAEDFGRRYAVLREGTNPEYLQSVRYLEGNTEYEVFTPKENIRIKMNGSGMNFVHGGVSLQEICVPLIDYTYLRNDSSEYKQNRSKYDTKPVTVNLLSANRKISNMIFSLNFYQKEAVGSNREAATYQLYFTDVAGKVVSDTVKLIADKSSENSQERTFRCNFSLKSMQFDSKATYYLVIADESGLQMPTREEFQIDIAFAVDELTSSDEPERKETQWNSLKM